VDYTEDLLPVLCLIDGSHRAARCRRDGLQFFACVLTEEESHLCQQSPKARLFRMLQGMQATHSDSGKEGFDPSCPKCRQRREGPELFRFERYDGAAFAWDIRMARELCSDGRSPSFVPPEALDAILSVNRTEPGHVDHVDPKIPGIACACGSATGQSLWVLIDGSHRAARCRRDGLPFLVHLLSDDESRLAQDEARRLLSNLS
jgi:hypothetical protein